MQKLMHNYTIAFSVRSSQYFIIKVVMRLPKVTPHVHLRPVSTAPVRVHTSQEQTGPVLHLPAHITADRAPAPTCPGASAPYKAFYHMAVTVLSLVDPQFALSHLAALCGELCF